MSFVHEHCIAGKRRRCSGYSLIEVVVAIAILSAMLMLGGMALNQGLSQYQGLAATGLRFWDHAQRIWMDKCFHSVMDYYVHTDAAGWFPYYEGLSDRMSFVTSAAFANDLPVAVWIIKEKTDTGKMMLNYYELPLAAKTYRDLMADSASDAYRKGATVTIVKDADEVQIQYFGYSVRDEKRIWRSSFVGSDTLQIPELIRIDYTQEGKKKMFLYAVHVTSQMKRNYEYNYAK